MKLFEPMLFVPLMILELNLLINYCRDWLDKALLLFMLLLDCPVLQCHNVIL